MSGKPPLSSASASLARASTARSAPRRLVLACVICLAAVSPSQATPAAPDAIAAPSSRLGASLAKVVVPTVARSGAGSGRIVSRLATHTSWGGGPQQLLVLASARDLSGRRWLRVGLPARPNGATAWARADHVLLSRTDYGVEISTRKRLVSVYRSGRLVRQFRAVVGAPATPTPHGLFAVYEPIRQSNPRAALGPWAIHLTAFSDVLDNFGGGPGRVALHGRNGVLLGDPLGTARSHGCVRVGNLHVTWLATTLPRGTPVRIRP
jgi:hypothetical protein